MLSVAEAESCVPKSRVEKLRRCDAAPSIHSRSKGRGASCERFRAKGLQYARSTMYGERIGQLGAEKRPGWLAGRRKVAKSSMRHARGVAGLAVVAPPASQLSLPPPFPPLSCFPPHDTPVTRDTLRICVPSLPPLPCSPPSRPRSLRPRVRNLSSAPPSDVPLVALVEPRTAPLRPALDTGTATPSQGVSGHWGSLEFLLHGARTAPCG